ncbi:MAG: hypothetical protein NVS2B12_11380 [Ktedonobacteraceae bacterium]
MPKKSVAARGGVQRQKPRVQKSFELVRPGVDEREEARLGTVPEAPGEPADASAPQSQARVRTATAGPTNSATAAVAPQPAEAKGESSVAATPKTSASTRMAARRQSTQKAQQRNSTVLISAEHFSYVRRDLVIIATLAIIMFAAIIVLYFLFGRGV